MRVSTSRRSDATICTNVAEVGQLANADSIFTAFTIFTAFKTAENNPWRKLAERTEGFAAENYLSNTSMAFLS